ncbi:hypothetical protein HGRIS_000925 [Hohenbuehelia grisea]|uniref:Phorbol-ester/DAG-type domain-containing protein n=1 Tax=Hohenbuehelia grisea TaxID=104357 RepID=A0ABR3IQ66_9AGAR
MQLGWSWGTDRLKCPRCKHSNRGSIGCEPMWSMWIECARCSGIFRAGVESDGHLLAGQTSDLDSRIGHVSAAAVPPVDNGRSERLIDEARLFRRIFAILARPAALQQSRGIKSRPSQRQQDISEPVPSVNEKTHLFRKTTFSKAITCRVFLEKVKSRAVLCENCSLVAHAKCATHAAPTCDLRAMLLSLSSQISPLPPIVGDSTMSSIPAPQNNRPFHQLRLPKISEHQHAHNILSPHNTVPSRPLFKANDLVQNPLGLGRAPHQRLGRLNPRDPQRASNVAYVRRSEYTAQAFRRSESNATVFARDHQPLGATEDPMRRTERWQRIQQGIRRSESAKVQAEPELSTEDKFQTIGRAGARHLRTLSRKYETAGIS